MPYNYFCMGLWTQKMVIAKLKAPFISFPCCHKWLSSTIVSFFASCAFFLASYLGCTISTCVFKRVIIFFNLKKIFIKIELWDKTLHDIFFQSTNNTSKYLQIFKIYMQIIIHNTKTPTNWNIAVWFPKCSLKLYSCKQQYFILQQVARF